MLGFASLLTGCSSPLSRPTQDGATDQWQMQARVGIKTADEAGSFGLAWQQRSDSFELHLNGALGIPIAHVYGEPSGVRIDVPKQGSFEADNASDLLEQYAGLALPVESLQYWVRGGPAPNVAFEAAENSLLQSGWTIEYLKYQDDLPVRIRLSSAAMRILLVVKSWR